MEVKYVRSVAHGVSPSSAAPTRSNNARHYVFLITLSRAYNGGLIKMRRINRGEFNESAGARLAITRRDIQPSQGTRACRLLRKMAHARRYMRTARRKKGYRASEEYEMSDDRQETESHSTTSVNSRVTRRTRARLLISSRRQLSISYTEEI